MKLLNQKLMKSFWAALIPPQLGSLLSARGWSRDTKKEEERKAFLSDFTIVLFKFSPLILSAVFFDVIRSRSLEILVGRKRLLCSTAWSRHPFVLRPVLDVIPIFVGVHAAALQIALNLIPDWRDRRWNHAFVGWEGKVKREREKKLN